MISNWLANNRQLSYHHWERAAGLFSVSELPILDTNTSNTQNNPDSFHLSIFIVEQAHHRLLHTGITISCFIYPITIIIMPSAQDVADEALLDLEDEHADSVENSPPETIDCWSLEDFERLLWAFLSLGPDFESSIMEERPWNDCVFVSFSFMAIYGDPDPASEQNRLVEAGVSTIDTRVITDLSRSEESVDTYQESFWPLAIPSTTFYYANRTDYVPPMAASTFKFGVARDMQDLDDGDHIRDQLLDFLLIPDEEAQEGHDDGYSSDSESLHFRKIVIVVADMEQVGWVFKLLNIDLTDYDHLVAVINVQTMSEVFKHIHMPYDLERPLQNAYQALEYVRCPIWQQPHGMNASANHGNRAHYMLLAIFAMIRLSTEGLRRHWAVSGWQGHRRIRILHAMDHVLGLTLQDYPEDIRHPDLAQLEEDTWKAYSGIVSTGVCCGWANGESNGRNGMTESDGSSSV